jgi:hypothetical protein
MSISSISSLTQTQAVSFQSRTKSSEPSSGNGDQTSMSKIGQVMAKLSDLEKTDPAKAKQVLQTIASKLTDAANSATGDEADHLKDLAAKFTKAADTGDLSGIQPPKGGHHGPPPAKPASSDASADASTDSSAASSKTEKYKHHGHKPDVAALDQIFESAYSSVTSAAS